MLVWSCWVRCMDLTRVAIQIGWEAIVSVDAYLLFKLEKAIQ